MAYSTGTATDEQELVDEVSSFLVDQCGWTLVETVTDTASDNDRVFKNVRGGGYKDIYVRWRGYSNYLYVYGYTRWEVSEDYDDEMHSSSYSRAPASASPITYWFFGNSTRLIVLLKNGSDYLSLYGGHIHSYYSVDEDEAPLCIMGQSSDSERLSGNRALMYVPFSLASGTSKIHKSHYDLADYCLKYGSPNVRDGSIAMLPTIMYCGDTSYEEVRGELNGVMSIYGAGTATESWITVSGTDYKYMAVIHAETDSNAFAYGPVPV